MIYVVWIAAFFFAGSWTFGVILNPGMRLKSTLVTIAYWWISIVMALISLFSAWNLLWLMPLAVLVPMLAMHAEISSSLRTYTSTIFMKTGLLFIPLLAALTYFSR